MLRLNNALVTVLKRRALLSSILLISLSGCGTFLSGAGPYKGSILDGASQLEYPYTLIDLSVTRLGEFGRPAEPVPNASVSTMTAPTITLLAGDVLRVMIADNGLDGSIFAPISTGGTVFGQVRLDSKGNIALPYVGSVEAAGKTVAQLEDAIRRKLSGIASDGQVYIELVGDLSGSVLVTGAVKAPRRVSTLQGPLTLLDAINLAGGPVLEPHLVNVTVRDGKNITSYSYQELLAGNNRPLLPRSEIVVERARKRFVAMGAVKQPGLHDLPSEYSSLLEVLGTVGGLSEATADPQGVFIFRKTIDKLGQNSAQVFQLDMRNPVSIFYAKEFLVLSEDAIYVTNAKVYEWQKIISPIVQTLILGRTLQNF